MRNGKWNANERGVFHGMQGMSVHTLHENKVANELHRIRLFFFSRSQINGLVMENLLKTKHHNDWRAMNISIERKCSVVRLMQFLLLLFFHLLAIPFIACNAFMQTRHYAINENSSVKIDVFFFISFLERVVFVRSFSSSATLNECEYFNAACAHAHTQESR